MPSFFWDLQGDTITPHRQLRSIKTSKRPTKVEISVHMKTNVPHSWAEALSCPLTRALHFIRYRCRSPVFEPDRLVDVLLYAQAMTESKFSF